MQHLNYSRQMVKQFTSAMKNPSVRPDMKEYLAHCIDLAKRSQKFILPDGGRVYDDPEYKALDETQPLRLPFPLIAIEFTRSDEYINSHPLVNKENTQPNKSLMFAREQGDHVTITVVAWSTVHGNWAPLPEVAIPLTGYLDRTQRFHGYVSIAIVINPNAAIPVPGQDYTDEIGAMLCMLNVLNCNNVHIERSEPSKVKKKIKSAFPFDTYNILTIEAPGANGNRAGSGLEHRSPREHLRRGHIRRLQDGRRIWVNACVVAAGQGSGVVSKDYTIKART